MQRTKLGIRPLATLLALIMAVGVLGFALPAQASGDITVYIIVEAYNVCG